MGCLSIDDNIPDINYNFFTKVESQKKEGLDIYKASSTIDYYTVFRCPLCKCLYSKEEEGIIKNKIKDYPEKKMLSNIEHYNGQTESGEKIDNIDELESIYNQIQEIAKSFEQNRYHKHTCTNNELCQRSNNQDIYIDLCSIGNIKNYIENKLKVNLNKWKNDNNYKNEYLKNKKIKNDIYLKKQRKAEIERQYKSSFEEYTFKSEKDQYNYIIAQIKSELDNCQQKVDNNQVIGIDMRPQASWFWSLRSNELKYSSSKKKLKAYIEEKRGQSLYEEIKMSKKEYKEFQQYILKREPKYKEVMNID